MSDNNFLNDETQQNKHTKPNLIRSIFITGFLALLPLVITVYLLKIFYSIITSNLMPLLLKVASANDIHIPESLMGLLTILVFAVIIFLVGILTRMYVGRLLLGVMDRTFNGIPFVKTIYNSVRQMIDSFGSSTNNFRKVIVVEFPKDDVYCIAFVVRNSQPILSEAIGEPCYNVFVPTTPNPTSGFITIIPSRKCIDLPISVEEGFKFIFSVGIIHFTDKQSAQNVVSSFAKKE